MTLIQPETVPTKGVGKYFNLVALNFPMNPSSVSFYWQLFTEAENEEQESIPGSCILDGNLSMDQETYAEWGTNDEYPINWALNQLGFTKA